MRARLLPVLFFCATANASTLGVTIATHSVAIGPMPRMRVERVAFAGEPLTATVTLDVYSVPALPSAKEHLATLQRLTDDNWTSHLTFEVTGDGAPGRISVRTMAAHARHMGPGSPEPGAKTVPFTAFARVAPQWAEAQEQHLAVDVGHIHALQQMLPTYFAQRTSLRLTTDPQTGRYQLVERRTGRLVREER